MGSIAYFMAYLYDEMNDGVQQWVVQRYHRWYDDEMDICCWCHCDSETLEDLFLVH